MDRFKNKNLLYLGASLFGSYIFYKFILSKNKKANLLLKREKKGILNLIDSNVDHLFSVKDLIAPKADAFDKPIEFCKKIKKINQDIPIKLIISTRGGSLTSCEKILKQLKKHKSGYIAYIKNECFSAGTLIALGAKEIVMKEDSYLGKIDPQISASSEAYPAIIFHNLDEKHISSFNIHKVNLSKQVLNYTEEILNEIYPQDSNVKKEIRKNMIYSELPHNKTFNYDICQKMEINVRLPKDDEMYLFEDS